MVGRVLRILLRRTGIRWRRGLIEIEGLGVVAHCDRIWQFVWRSVGSVGRIRCCHASEGPCSKSGIALVETWRLTLRSTGRAGTRLRPIAHRRGPPVS